MDMTRKLMERKSVLKAIIFIADLEYLRPLFLKGERLPKEKKVRNIYIEERLESRNLLVPLPNSS